MFIEAQSRDGGMGVNVFFWGIPRMDWQIYDLQCTIYDGESVMRYGLCVMGYAFPVWKRLADACLIHASG